MGASTPSRRTRRQRLVGRRDVLQLGALLGIILPVAACGAGDADGPREPDASGQPDRAGAGSPTAPDGRSVIVVGAGPAGLSAAHLLVRAGVEVTVLEAAPAYGGRVRRTLDLVDFPIPLGA